MGKKAASSNIKVVCRFRPPNSRETALAGADAAATPPLVFSADGTGITVQNEMGSGANELGFVSASFQQELYRRNFNRTGQLPVEIELTDRSHSPCLPTCRRSTKSSRQPRARRMRSMSSLPNQLWPTHWRASTVPSLPMARPALASPSP